MKKLIFIIAGLSFSIGLFAQNEQSAKQIKRENRRNRIDSLVKQQEEGVIVFTKQTDYGLKLNSNGYGFFFEKGYAKTLKKSLFYQFEIAEVKDNKEYKSSSGSFFSGNPFIYGKINFLYPVKFGVAQQIVLGNKANKNGVSVSANFGGGGIIGLLRPYEIMVSSGGTAKYVSYNSNDSLLYLNSYQDPNASGPGLSRGWNHMKVVPGLYAKAAVRFDYAKLNEMVSAFEVGVDAQMYSQKIPMMIYTKQKNLFASAYFAIIFGKRK